MQHTARVGLALLLAALLSGCETQPISTSDVASGVRRTESKFDQFGTVIGPEVSERVARGILSDRVSWRIYASVLKDGNATAAHRLVASVWHQDRSWRFYRSASFEGGMAVQAARVNADPSCMTGGGYTSCTFTETVSVPISAAQWAEARDNGLEIRLNADRGPPVVVVITSSYVRGFERGAAKR